MGQTSKHLWKVVGLGLIGALLTAGGCALETAPQASWVKTESYYTGVGAFFITMGVLFLAGAIVVMIVWGIKSAKS